MSKVQREGNKKKNRPSLTQTYLIRLNGTFCNTCCTPSPPPASSPPKLPSTTQSHENGRRFYRGKHREKQKCVVINRGLGGEKAVSFPSTLLAALNDTYNGQIIAVYRPVCISFERNDSFSPATAFSKNRYRLCP